MQREERVRGVVQQLHEEGELALTRDALRQLLAPLLEQRGTGRAGRRLRGLRHTPPTVAVTMPLGVDLECRLEHVIRDRVDGLRLPP
eukprot:scaffold31647_cov79-Phaeocystis_antarctica.AAC.1